MKLSIGENIRRLRIERGLTQEKLSDFLGVSFQAVSKWERNESIPDIFMLPTIASFFGVTIDHLFHFNEIEKEKEIEGYEAAYYRLWHEDDRRALLTTMKEAVQKYPAEHRLLVRYLNAIDHIAEGDSCQALLLRNEAFAVYERILSHCTADSIRIRAKNLMCHFCKTLSRIPESGVTIEDAEKILGEMPLMQNCRDFLAPFLYADDRKDAASKAAIAELSQLMSTIVIENWIYGKDHSVSEKIDALETLLALCKILYPADDCGKNTVNVVHAMMHLVHLYDENGDKEKAASMLRQCLALSARLDEARGPLVHEGALLAGVSIEKDKIPGVTAEPLAEQVKNYLFRHKKLSL